MARASEWRHIQNPSLTRCRTACHSSQPPSPCRSLILAPGLMSRQSMNLHPPRCHFVPVQNRSRRFPSPVCRQVSPSTTLKTRLVTQSCPVGCVANSSYAATALGGAEKHRCTPSRSFIGSASSSFLVSGSAQELRFCRRKHIVKSGTPLKPGRKGQKWRTGVRCQNDEVPWWQELLGELGVGKRRRRASRPWGEGSDRR